MHDFDPFEKRFAAALRSEADLSVVRFEAASIARAAIDGSKPRSFVRRRGVVRTPARPMKGVAYLLVILALVAAFLAAAIAGGALRQGPQKLGRNGAIAYSVQDNSPRYANDAGSHVLDYRVHLIRPDGTGDRQIGQGGCPTFSNDGSVFAYQDASHGEGRLDVSAADGTSVGVVRDVGVTGFMDSEIALSPDGRQIAWLKHPANDPPFQTALWVTSVSGGAGARIVPESDDPNEWYSFPVWSPDGRHVAFARNRWLIGSDDPGDYGSYRTEIDVVGSDGSDLRRITARPGTDQIGISWSPDGRSITYVGLPDGSAIPSLPTAGLPAAIQPVDIFGINVDGTDDRNLTNSEADEHGPQWSPDGTHIAYQTSQDGGRTAVVRVDGATGVGSPIRSAGNSDMYPSFAWSPDGTKLLVVESDASDPSDIVQSTSSTVLSVDAEFRQAPVTLLAVDHDIRCAPSWQWLAP